MAKIEKAQMEVTLSSETKRYLRNLTSALEKVARAAAMYKPQEPKDGPKRLSEPAEDEPKKYAAGGFVSPGSEPISGVQVGRVELDAAAIQNLTQGVMNQKSYLQ